MDPTALNQTIQYIAWFLAIAELIVGLYILALNPRHIANRHVGIFLLLSAVNSYALGMMVMSGSSGQAQLPAVMLAMTTSATEPLLLLCSVALLRPRWLTGERRWRWYPIYALAILPAALTLLDLNLGTRLWYSGIDPSSYSGGFLITPQFTSGSVSVAVRAGFILSFLIISAFLVYVAVIDKKSSPADRKLAWLLLFQQFLAGAILTYLGQKVILPSVSVLLANTIFVITYAYAAFGQMISERSRQSGSLQARLTLVVLLVALPVMLALTAFIVDRAQRILEADANRNLSSAVEQLELNVRLWSGSQERLLSDLASRPEIASMQAALQTPILRQIVAEHPELNSAITLDPLGRLVAHSDTLPVDTYDSDGWYKQVSSGSFLLTVADGSDAGHSPILVSAAPITGADGARVGVLALTTSPEALGAQFGTHRIGEAGYTYVVNAADQLVAYPEGSFEASELDLYQHPGVTQLRMGSLGPFTFADPTGLRWRVKAGLLPNGWGVVAQVPENELLDPLTGFGRMAWLGLASASILLLVLAVLMVRQTLHPIRSLMQVTVAVSAGKLSQVVPV
ncbi:MAG: cache domain-containing protein, partial [Anaerolineales bacterium]